MKIYQIYVPELASYVKYKVLTPEDIEALVAELSGKTTKEFKLSILENVKFIFY